MKALVLERRHELALREIATNETVGPRDVKIRVHTVGICGSDVHYFEDGKIGPFVVNAPMILGHEASGVVVEVGAEVTNLKVGDRVCAEPGIPDMSSKATKLGVYNLDPAVRFWATPPVHGCLIRDVVHPAAFTYRLPEAVSFAEGAMVEPFAIGMQAASKARIKPGDVAIVTGAGPIGTMVALAALAGGAARVFITDVMQPKLDIAGQYPGITPVNITRENLAALVSAATNGWGADVLFECSGAPPVFKDLTDPVAPNGTIVLVGMPVNPVPVDIVKIQAKELRLESVFRYANLFERSLQLIASGKVDLKPLITGTYGFSESIPAFHRAAEHRATDVKVQIVMEG